MINFIKWRLVLYLMFCIFLVREIIFLSGKSQKILKTGTYKATMKLVEEIMPVMWPFFLLFFFFLVSEDSKDTSNQ